MLIRLIFVCFKIGIICLLLILIVIMYILVFFRMFIVNLVNVFLIISIIYEIIELVFFFLENGNLNFNFVSVLLEKCYFLDIR